MSTTKGKEKNSSVKGTWLIELSQPFELEQNQKVETWRKQNKNRHRKDLSIKDYEKQDHKGQLDDKMVNLKKHAPKR